MVDARDDQIGIEALDEPEAREAHAVDRRPVCRVADRAVVKRHLLTHSGRRVVIERAIAERLPSGAITARRTPSSADERAAHRLQALGLDPVIVCQQYVEHRSRPA